MLMRVFDFFLCVQQIASLTGMGPANALNQYGDCAPGATQQSVTELAEGVANLGKHGEI